MYRPFRPVMTFNNPQIHRLMLNKPFSKREREAHHFFQEIEFLLKIFTFPSLLEKGEYFLFENQQKYVTLLLERSAEEETLERRAFLIWLSFRFLGNLLLYTNMFLNKTFKRNMKSILEDIALHGLHLAYLIDPKREHFAPSFFEDQTSLHDLFEQYPLH